MPASKTLPEKVKQMIDGKNFAQVATLNKDGSPQVTTAWIDRDGDSVLINTAEGRLKANNLMRDPRVAIALNNANNPYEAVYIRGKVAEVIRGAKAEEHIHKMSKKYMGKEKYPLQPGEKRIVFRVQPTHVSGWG